MKGIKTNELFKIHTKPKFVIVTQRQHHGGPIVLHTLCKHISANGYNAKVYYLKDNPPRPFDSKEYHDFIFRTTICDAIKNVLVKIRFIDWNKYPRFKDYLYEPVKGCRRKWLPCFDDKTIVVYPELYYGNPLHAKKVVRWLLYYNRYPDDEEAYGKQDLFFCFREIFNDKKLNPTVRKLKTTYFDLGLYKRTNFGKREGKCYIIRKGRKREDLPEEFDGIIIDDLPEKEKVRAFNKCEYCISYDTQTSYSSIAALCGCISIIVPEPGKKREDYRGKGEDGWGLAYGFEQSEIDFAMETRDRIRENFENANEMGKESVKAFIGECEKYLM